MNVGDHSASVGDHIVSVGNSHVGVYCEFGLEIPSEQWSYGNDGTHVEYTKYPGEVQTPGSDLFLVILRMQMSGNRISLSLLDDVPLHLRHSSRIW